MLQERLAAPLPHHPPPAPPRPRKRRRTATQVLAGYFDSPNLSRDFFTDMANTDETIRVVNSIIARNSSLLIDPRFQHIGPFKTHLQSHGNRHHHRSLTIRLPPNEISDATPAASTSQHSRETTQATPLDRRTKLMGRIQDISHLLLSPRDEREFVKETIDSSLNPPPQTAPPPNAQPNILIPLSPQNSAIVSAPSQGEDYFPRQLRLPELEESQRRRQRSPDIMLMEQDSASINVGDIHSPRHRLASFTASPPTPTRSITSLTSHTSSKWPHTPDNEVGPSFTDMPASYAEYASYRHEPSNGDITIIHPQSPPTSSWQHTPSAPSPKSPSAVEPPQWMMTHTQEVKQPQSMMKRSRGFSLDNILSPPAASDTCDFLHSRPMNAGNDDEPTAMEVDHEGEGNDGRGDETMEDIRRPFAKTPERELSVGSDHPLQPRSRRRSRAMKIVESDDDTEGERERLRKPGGGDLGHKQRLTIRIRPLMMASTSSATPKSGNKIPMGLVTSPAEIKETEMSSSGAFAPSTADVSQVTTPSENHHQEYERDSSETVLPPLIPGKARKRKAPPAKKGWKGWVEVEVDENHKPAKALSLDDLPWGERRTRSGKQFDG